jgi:hypothetical protein
MIKGRGSTWGEDFVLSAALRREERAWVLTFTEILTLAHEAFYEIFASVSTDDFRFCRKIIVKMTVVRGIIHYAGRMLNKDPSLGARLMYRIRSDHPEDQDQSLRTSQKVLRRRSSILLTNLEKKRAADAIADENRERKIGIRDRLTELDGDELDGPQAGVSVSLIRQVIRAELRRSEDQSDVLLQSILHEVGQMRLELNAVASRAPYATEDMASSEEVVAQSSSNPDQPPGSFLCGSHTTCTKNGGGAAAA